MRLRLPKLQQKTKDQLLLGIGTLIIFVLSFPPKRGRLAFLTTNGASQYLMTKALVEDGTFEISKYKSRDFPFFTIDRAIYDGKYFSSKPPGASIVAIPFYIVGRFIADLLGYKDVTREFFLTTSVLFSSALFASFTIIIVYRFANLYASREISLLTAVSMAFGTILWAYARTFFRHSIVTFFVTLTAYLLVKYERTDQVKVLLWASIASGFAIISEWGAILLLIPQFGYLLGKRHLTISDLQKTILYGIGPLCAFLFIGIFNTICFGDPLSFSYMNSDYIAHMPSEGDNVMDKLFNLDIISHFQHLAWMTFIFQIIEYEEQTGISANRAIFLLTPILILGLVGYILLLKKDRKLTIYLGSSSLLILFLYARWEEWNGGFCWGSRQLLMIIPLLIIPMIITIERFGHRRFFWIVFLVLLGHSSVNSFIGGVSGWGVTYSLEFFRDELYIRDLLFPGFSLFLIFCLELLLFTLALINIPKIYRYLNQRQQEKQFMKRLDNGF